MQTVPRCPAAVYVCICNGVTDHAIRRAAEQGARSLADLGAMTGCGTTCGSCLDLAGSVLEDALAQPLPLPVYAAAA